MRNVGRPPAWEPETKEEEDAVLAMMMMAMPGKVVGLDGKPKEF